MELSEKPNAVTEKQISMNAVTEEQISIIERFTGFLYYGQCINSTNSERMRDTTVKIRDEGAYEACCVLRRLGQFLICRKCLHPLPFSLGLEI